MKTTNIIISTQNNNKIILEHFTENLYLLKQKFFSNIIAKKNKEKSKHFINLSITNGPVLKVGQTINKKTITDIVKYNNMYDFMIELQ